MAVNVTLGNGENPRYDITDVYKRQVYILPEQPGKRKTCEAARYADTGRFCCNFPIRFYPFTFLIALS